MSRSRIIKPGFFTNDKLAEVKMAGRLLFAGLWTMCDREGRMQDRPKKIKAEVLPFDNVNVDSLLNELHRAGFIVRYTVAEERYIAIPSFKKHQNPHIREAASTLPPPPVCTNPAPGEHSAEHNLGDAEHESSTAYAGAQDPVLFFNDSVPASPPATAEADGRKSRRRLITDSDIERWEDEHPELDIHAFVADYLNWAGSSKHVDKVQGFENQLRIDFKKKQFTRQGRSGSPPTPVSQSGEFKLRNAWDMMAPIPGEELPQDDEE
jgi:hypothetical protein